MKKEFLTVNEFARELNISVQAIYKRINKPNSDLKPFLKRDNGKTYIDKAALNVIYQFKEQEEENNTDTVEILKAEIEEKNKQIQSLLERLESQQELLNQQQKLMLLDKEKILMLEEEQTERKGIFSIFKRKKKEV